MNSNRKALIVGNWKMHLTVHKASLLVHNLSQVVETHRNVDVVLCPTFLGLQTLSLQIDRHQFKLGAQNCYHRDEGAFTGEVSAAQLHGVVDYVLVGHSERRNIFGETEKDIRAKVQAVVRNKMRPILCVGETARQRADNETKHVIQDQVASGLANVTSEEVEEIVIAYEPVWAIGSGVSAQPRDIETAAGIIHKQVAALFGDDAAEKLRIIYGGSVTDETAGGILSVERIDGLLPGGISLNAHAFANIVETAHNKHKDITK